MLLGKGGGKVKIGLGMIKWLIMKGAFWNVRGLNKACRMNGLADFVRTNKLDFMGIQETKKTSISDGFFGAVCKHMNWDYLLAKGSAGGILIGVRSECFSTSDCEKYNYCMSIMIRNCVDKYDWKLIVVYGSPYEEHKSKFLEELDSVMAVWQGTTLIGGTLI
jgi:exonuclease III